MAEYIDKEQAIDKFIEGDGDDEFTEGYNFAVNEYREKIKAMPAADVQPIVYAHKTINVGRRSYCSNCGKLAIMEDFCSKCGAKVKDGDTNE